MFKFKEQLVLLFILSFCVSCKTEFLDIKKDKRTAVPNTAEALLAILDNTTVMNISAGATLAEMSSDNYFIDENRWNTLSDVSQKNAYIWNSDIFEGSQSIDWNRGYTRVLMTNVVLENIGELRNKGEKNEVFLNYVEACALFHRSWNFHILTMLFSPAYHPNLSNNELLGIPLRLTSKLDDKISRASLEVTYNQMITDLLKAESLIGKDELFHNTRPSLLSIRTLLSRLYLMKYDYSKSIEYAKKVLEIKDNLLDYNEIDGSKTFPFAPNNVEIIFNDVVASTTILNRTRLQIDTFLYASYHKNDLRKNLFFGMNGGILTFRGSYYGGSAHFIGLGISEVYLTLIESLVRLGRFEESREYLKTFLKSRYLHSTIFDEILPSDEFLLEYILSERRKEMVFRGIRWADLKRLNHDELTQTTLKRYLFGQYYKLLPNDSRYIFPIPDNAILLGGYIQNQRN